MKKIGTTVGEASCVNLYHLTILQMGRLKVGMRPMNENIYLEPTSELFLIKCK